MMDKTHQDQKTQENETLCSEVDVELIRRISFLRGAVTGVIVTLAGGLFMVWIM